MLVVGHGAPTVGGIPSYLSGLTSDGWLRQRADLVLLNTAPAGPKVPGAPSWGNFGRTFLHARWIFRAVRRHRIDVVHLNLAATPLLPLGRALVLAAVSRAAGARVALHAHTGLLGDCVVDARFRMVLRISLRLVDVFIVVSRSAEAAVRSVGPTAQHKVVRLENGVDVDRFQPSPKNRQPPRLVFVGTVCERKGLIDLRDALALLEDEGRLPFEALVVGNGEQEDPGSMDRVVASYRATGRDDVRFLGALPNEEVAALLSRADIFCLPSHTEGAPLSMLEAMASGTAVVATDVGEVAALLGGGEAGIVVPPRDPAALAQALRQLVSDPGERLRLGQRARARAVERYSAQRMRATLLDLYTRLTVR